MLASNWGFVFITLSVDFMVWTGSACYGNDEGVANTRYGWKLRLIGLYTQLWLRLRDSINILAKRKLTFHSPDAFNPTKPLSSKPPLNYQWMPITSSSNPIPCVLSQPPSQSSTSLTYLTTSIWKPITNQCNIIPIYSILLVYCKHVFEYMSNSMR